MATRKPPPVPKSSLHDDYMDNDLFDDRRRMALDIEDEMDQDELDQLVIAAQKRSSKSKKAPVAVPLKAKKFAKVLGIPSTGTRYIPRPRELIAYDEPEIFDDIAESGLIVEKNFGGRRVVIAHRSRDEIPSLPPIRNRLTLAQRPRAIQQSNIELRINKPNFKKAVPINRFRGGIRGRNFGIQRGRSVISNGGLSLAELDKELDSYMKGNVSIPKKNASIDDLDQDLETYMQGNSSSGSAKHPRVNIS